MRLLLIHGRAQGGKDAAELKEAWLAALAQGLKAAGAKLPPRTTVVFPYYGDLLDRLIAELDSPPADVGRKGPMAVSAATQLRVELLQELATANGITAADILGELPEGVAEKGILNWEWVQAILRALDRTPLGQIAIDQFTRDVSVYLANAAVRRQVNAVVAAEVATGPCVVVAHSLGTIVAYDVLRSMAPPASVPQLVTLGSPLGIRAIRQRLVPTAWPPGVDAWFNALDPRDAVALYPLDVRTFNVGRAITNKRDVRNHTENRHGIDGYLDDATVAREIAASVGP